ncbi:MAG: WhiB family transcriptional regulator [Candidatus Saccharibacteria bacterium]|nr:WhiB family transcriptional regulator [Candidatus Saccharibacteria bacterium]
MTREQQTNAAPATQAMREQMKSDGVSPAVYTERLLREGYKLAPRSAWIGQAACSLEDEQYFIGLDGRKREHWENIEKGKTICRHCPVQAECLAAHMASVTKHQPDTDVVVGGTDNVERARARRQVAQELARRMQSSQGDGKALA